MKRATVMAFVGLFFAAMQISCGARSARLPDLVRPSGSLLASNAVCRRLPALQQIIVERGEKQQSFTVAVECGNERTVIAGFGPFDLPLFVLRWENGARSYRPNPHFDALLDPETILVHLALAFFEPGDAASALAPDHRLTTKGLVRSVYRGDILQLVIRLPRDSESPVRLFYPAAGAVVRAFSGEGGGSSNASNPRL